MHWRSSNEASAPRTRARSAIRSSSSASFSAPTAATSPVIIVRDVDMVNIIESSSRRKPSAWALRRNLTRFASAMPK